MNTTGANVRSDFATKPNPTAMKKKPSRSAKPTASSIATFNIRWRSKQSSTMKGRKHVTAADEKEARRNFEAQYPDAQIVEVTS